MLVIALAALLAAPILPLTSAIPVVGVHPPVDRAVPSSGSAMPTPLQHVVVLYFENNNRSTTLAQGPYFRYLADTYAQASHYYALCHPSAPNYLGGTSGASLQCRSDAYHTYATTNLATLLNNASISDWTAFMESMPKPCDTANSGDRKSVV
jgi:hypothetical protein